MFVTVSTSSDRRTGHTDTAGTIGRSWNGRGSFVTFAATCLD